MLTFDKSSHNAGTFLFVGTGWWFCHFLYVLNSYFFCGFLGVSHKKIPDFP